MWETSAMEIYMPSLSSFSKYLRVALETPAYDNSKPEEHLGDKTNNCQTKFEKNVGRQGLENSLGFLCVSTYSCAGTCVRGQEVS